MYLPGLSPHTRGNLIDTNGSNSRVGPIPAYAGEPSSESMIVSTRRAYPRIRGGTPPSAAFAAAVLGLSPHTRGNLDQLKSTNEKLGPIPAYAGEPG